MTTPTDLPITAADVESHTSGRVPADLPGMEGRIAAALGALRRYCGWHVFPVIDDEFRLDGPGGKLLNLPTLRLVELTAVTNGTQVVDLSTLTWSDRGMIARRNRGWSADLGAITVAARHGFDSAPELVANLCEVIAQSADRPGQPGLASLRVGERQESYNLTMTGGGLPAGAVAALWDSYRLPRLA